MSVIGLGWRCGALSRYGPRVRRYQTILHRDPLRTKMLSSFVIWGGIDALRSARAKSQRSRPAARGPRWTATRGVVVRGIGTPAHDASGGVGSL